MLQPERWEGPGVRRSMGLAFPATLIQWSPCAKHCLNTFYVLTHQYRLLLFCPKKLRVTLQRQTDRAE